MKIEKSRNGFYTVTFVNKSNLTEKQVLDTFNTVGKVCQIARNNGRVFVRFQQREEAERAILKFGKSLNLDIAKNTVRNSDNQVNEAAAVRNKENTSVKNFTLDKTPTDVNPEMSQLQSGFHLILGNLPKNYTLEDVKGLVEEAEPLAINSLDETKALHLTYCHIVLKSADSLLYLINKLDGFVICGQKLIAVEAKKLIEWRQFK